MLVSREFLMIYFLHNISINIAFFLRQYFFTSGVFQCTESLHREAILQQKRTLRGVTTDIIHRNRFFASFAIRDGVRDVKCCTQFIL